MGVLNSFKLGPKIIGWYVVAGVAMAILAYMLLSSLSGLSTKFNFLVHHDTPVLINAVDLTGEMVNMETGLRGHLVTGVVGFLEPYHSGITESEETMTAERDLTAAVPAL